MFTLKVIERAGLYLPDRRHAAGGIDVRQIYAFHHLFPAGFCPWTHRELLSEMTHLHGWDLVIRKATKDDDED